MPGVADVRRAINDMLIDVDFDIRDRQEMARRFNLGGQQYGYLAFMRGPLDVTCWHCKGDLTCIARIEARHCPWCGAEIGSYGGLARAREEVLDAAQYTIFDVLNGTLDWHSEHVQQDLRAYAEVLRRYHAAADDGA